VRSEEFWYALHCNAFIEIVAKGDTVSQYTNNQYTNTPISINFQKERGMI